MGVLVDGLVTAAVCSIHWWRSEKEKDTRITAPGGSKGISPDNLVFTICQYVHVHVYTCVVTLSPGSPRRVCKYCA